MARTDIVVAQDVWGWLTALLVATGLALLPLPSWLIDQVYCRAIYPTLQPWLTGLSNLVPFSLLDFLILTAIFVFFRRAFRLVVAVRTIGFMPAVWQGVRRVVRVVSIVVIVFMITWGLNYRRLPLGAQTGGPVTPTTEMLLATLADANVLAARLRDTRPVDMSFDSVADKLREPMNQALMQLDLNPMGQHGRPKFSFMLTPFFTWTGVDGMIDPLALESIVHPDLLPFERPFALAHSWAHLAGQADEGEAGAVAWLACMNGPPPLAYSASLFLIREATVALPAELRSDATSRLDPGVRSDLVAVAERLQQEQPAVHRAANEIYDEYLKANHVEDGTASYGRALALILSPRIHDALVNYRFGARGRP